MKRLENDFLLNGVQGVESSNLFAPTNKIKHLANPSGLAFCFLGPELLYTQTIPKQIFALFRRVA